MGTRDVHLKITNSLYLILHLTLLPVSYFISNHALTFLVSLHSSPADETNRLFNNAIVSHPRSRSQRGRCFVQRSSSTCCQQRERKKPENMSEKWSGYRQIFATGANAPSTLWRKRLMIMSWDVTLATSGLQRLRKVRWVTSLGNSKTKFQNVMVKKGEGIAECYESR